MMTAERNLNPEVLQDTNTETAGNSMSKALSVSQILSKTYKTFPELSDEWIAAIGEVETNFRMIVYGGSGHGKTTFVVKLCAELAKHGKVYYNSVEQGDSKSFQSALRQGDMDGLPASQFSIGNKDDLPTMLGRLKTNRSHFVVIDSIDAMKFTIDDYHDIIKRFKNKAFIFIAWGTKTGDEPKGYHAKEIKFMVDVKIHVREGIATAASRYGHTVPYDVFAGKVVTTDGLPAQTITKIAKSRVKKNEAQAELFQ